MKIQKAGQKLMLKLEKGEEIIQSLTRVCKNEGIKLASLSGIGAADNLRIGSMDPLTGIYASRTFTGMLEITSLSGNITMRNGEPFPHIHIVVGDENCNAYAGHLLEANINVTCEIVLTIIDGEITRSFDDSVKAKTWDL